MAKEIVKLDWKTVNVETMPPALLKQYNEYRKAAEALKAVRESMEQAVTLHLTKAKKIPVGEVPRYNYKWGKMSIAFADANTVKTTGADAFTF